MEDLILHDVELIVTIIGILITALFAIYSIRKTAEANRVSMVHNEMLHCLVEGTTFIREMSVLLNAVSNRTSFYSVPDGKLIETAYDRYWSEINNLSQSFNSIQSKQIFVLPKPLYDKMQSIINKLNEARSEAKDLKPGRTNINSSTERLKGILKEISTIYVEFVHESRGYLGVDKLDPLSTKREQILGIEEEKTAN